MSLKHLIQTLLALPLLLLALHGQTATTPPLDPSGGRIEDRQQLRVLLEGMEAGINKLDIDALLKLAQPDVVITWQNAEVSRGHAQVRAYYERMIKGAGGAAIVRKLSTKATLGGPAVFYGDSAVAYGTTVDRYDLADGLAFTLNANWSTTVTKTSDGQWKVASLHFSTNLFDNALLSAAERMVWYAAGAAFVVGALLCWLLMRRRRPG
ncbi:YybH family protein [Roseateles sp. NT4]|uniref:YybH family protein n=1 Tax=Roseateles sp. NT4 TaxID=3453715 RepID=UPI003EE95BF8